MCKYDCFDDTIAKSVVVDVIGSLLPKGYSERGTFGFESDYWKENFNDEFEKHYGFPVYFSEVTEQKCEITVVLDQVSLSYFNSIIEKIFSSNMFNQLKKFSENIYVNGILIDVDCDNEITLVFGN